MNGFLQALFAASLLLYPASFRRAYASAMRLDFADQLAARPSALARVRYAFAAFADAVASASEERTSTLRADLGSALRSIGKAPGFAAVVIGTLALAIGANAAVFSIVRAVVLAPLPYPDPNSLVELSGLRDGADFGFSLPDFRDVHRASSSYSAAAVVEGATDLGAYLNHGEPHEIEVGGVTSQFFDVFGLPPLLGRYFSPHDTGAATPAIVLDESAWRKDFDADPAVVGSTIAIDDAKYRVIGIAPARLRLRDLFATDCDAWRLVDENASGPAYNRDSHYFDGAVARLRPGVSLAQARADAERAFAELRRRYPQSDTRFGVGTSPLLDEVVGNVRATLIAIFAAVSGVLAIACANVGNLFLGRTISREREITVRLALGASRGRIVAQVLTETSVYAAAGGAFGIALAALAIDGFIRPSLSFVPRIANVSLDPITLLYTVGLVAATTILAGIAPAIAFANRTSFDALKSAGRGGDSSGGARGRAALVVFEIAGALALVVTAGVVVRGYASLTSQPLGFDPNDIAIVGESATGSTRYATAARRRAFFDDSLARVRAIPGVRSAAWAFTAPFAGNQWSTGFQIVGSEVPASEDRAAARNAIGPDYFRVLGIPLLRGRPFLPSDGVGTKPIVIVNQAFVRTFLAGRDPLGVRITEGSIDERKSRGGEDLTIVGVAADARPNFSSRAVPTIYLPLAAYPPPIAVLLAKTAPGLALGGELSHAVAASDPRIAELPATTMRESMARWSESLRVTMQILIAMGCLGLLLALAGIFAIVSFGVAQRSQEFGIRMALGAPRSSIVAAVLLRAVRLAAIGIATGLVVAALCVRALTIPLYGVAPLDPPTFVCVVALIFGATLVAAAMPAIGATRVDPVVALRYE